MQFPATASALLATTCAGEGGWIPMLAGVANAFPLSQNIIGHATKPTGGKPSHGSAKLSGLMRQGWIHESGQ